MKKIIPSMLVGSLTFFLGVGSTVIRLRSSPAAAKQIVNPAPAQERTTSEQPILAFCELANNPDKYSGRTVRVSVTLSGFIHGMVLYDPNCSSIDTQTAVFYNQKAREEIEKRLAKVRGSDDWRIPVTLISTGEFRKVTPSNESDTIYDTAPLQFEIIKVEKVSKAN